MLATVGMGSLAFAADHTDGTTAAGGALNDPSVDVTDAFAWMSPDTTTTAGTVNLVLDVFPGASTTSQFSTTAKYVFHTQSKASYAATTAVKRDVICTFAGTPQQISCWIVDPTNANAVVDYVSGDATSSAAPLVSADSNIKAYTGPREDPFFFNLAGFRNATSTVAAAIKSYTGGDHATYITGFHTGPTTCPVLTTVARTAVTTQIAKDCTGTGTADDFFRKPDANADPATCTSAKPATVTTATVNEGFTGNVLSIVLSVNKTLLTSGGPILGVWAATTK
jgi:hypothetical protein